MEKEEAQNKHRLGPVGNCEWPGWLVGAWKEKDWKVENRDVWMEP